VVWEDGSREGPSYPMRQEACRRAAIPPIASAIGKELLAKAKPGRFRFLEPAIAVG